ncbi:Git3 domain-containing protein [Mycena venus]|uniref:Git3 domain-containing protein n=1 Tax=Mycena venus TaxID=2733690 RepID=A0A8H6XSH2_9AGAR|nr:Git3 domain-containing protein [Mycena venus]
MSNDTLLPDGSKLILRTAYTSREDRGVAVLVVISSCSFTAVIGLLLAISVSAFNTRSWNTDKHSHLFVRSQVAAYFISLLLSDLIQTLGSILNVKWIGGRAVAVGEQALQAKLLAMDHFTEFQATGVGSLRGTLLQESCWTTYVYGCWIQLCALYPGLPSSAWQYRIRRQAFFFPKNWIGMARRPKPRRHARQTDACLSGNEALA